MYQQVFARWDCVDSRERARERGHCIRAECVYVLILMCVRKYATYTADRGSIVAFSPPGGPVQKKPQTKHTQHCTYCWLIRPLGRSSPRVHGIWFRERESGAQQLLTFLLPPRCSAMRQIDWRTERLKWELDRALRGSVKDLIQICCRNQDFLGIFFRS
jgi:hypothetical protein